MEPLAPLSEREQRQLRQRLGERCRKVREELGLSQRRLAEVMHRSPGWVREIERGDQYAPPYLLWALCRASGRTPGWFYAQGEVSAGEPIVRRSVDGPPALVVHRSS